MRMILIFDSDKERCAAIYDTIKWADNRLKIIQVGESAECWATVDRQKPKVLICGDSIANIQPFVELARKRMPSTLMLLCGRSENSRLAYAFDGFLPTPPSRLAMLSYLQAQNKRKITKPFMPDTEAPARRTHFFDEKGDIHVMVGVDSPDEKLKFNLLTVSGIQIEAFIQQLGKQSPCTFRLVRKGNEIQADLTTALEDGDCLYLRASVAD